MSRHAERMTGLVLTNQLGNRGNIELQHRVPYPTAGQRKINTPAAAAAVTFSATFFCFGDFFFRHENEDVVDVGQQVVDGRGDRDRHRGVVIDASSQATKRNSVRPSVRACKEKKTKEERRRDAKTRYLRERIDGGIGAASGNLGREKWNFEPGQWTSDAELSGRETPPWPVARAVALSVDRSPVDGAFRVDSQRVGSAPADGVYSRC